MEGLGFIAISGFALAASALVGQNLGARQEGRAREAVRLTVGYCLIVTVTTAIAFLLIPDRLVSLFTRDTQVIADGVLYLRVIAFAQIGQSFELILEGALAGAGYTFCRRWRARRSRRCAFHSPPGGRSRSACSASGSH